MQERGWREKVTGRSGWSLKLPWQGSARQRISGALHCSFFERRSGMAGVYLRCSGPDCRALIACLTASSNYLAQVGIEVWIHRIFARIGILITHRQQPCGMRRSNGLDSTFRRHTTFSVTRVATRALIQMEKAAAEHFGCSSEPVHRSRLQYRTSWLEEHHATCFHST